MTESTAPISSPRCDAWRPTVDEPYPITPATETRCSFAAGHPGPHVRHGIAWTDEEEPHRQPAAGDET